MQIRVEADPAQPRVTITTSTGVVVTLPATVTHDGTAGASPVIELDVPALQSITFIDQLTHVSGAE